MANLMSRYVPKLHLKSLSLHIPEDIFLNIKAIIIPCTQEPTHISNPPWKPHATLPSKILFLHVIPCCPGHLEWAPQMNSMDYIWIKKLFSLNTLSKIPINMSQNEHKQWLTYLLYSNIQLLSHHSLSIFAFIPILKPINSSYVLPTIYDKIIEVPIYNWI